MIFSKFFKPKWQHKDINVRISAINEDLAVNDKEQYQTLASLAQTDENELVRRAALLKLNNFNEWLSASTNNSNTKVKEYAQKQVAQIILGEHELTLSKQEKLNYLATQNKNGQLEEWLKGESDPELIIALFDKIAKPQLTLTTFQHHAKEQVQKHLVDEAEDKALLEKLLKKSTLEEVSQYIADKLAAIEEFAAKPGKLKKQSQLILSKLLALKDLVDFEEMTAKKEQLVQEWSEIQDDLKTFLPAEVKPLIEKFESIEQQLSKIFAKKAEEFQQLQIAQKLAKEKADICAQLDAAIEDISRSLATAIYESRELDEASYQQEITTLNEQVASSVLNDQQKQSYHSKLEQQQSKLSQLPVIAQSVTQATHLISKISQLALPTNIEALNERQPVYNDWLSKWKEVEKQAEGFLPESILDAYREIEQAWRTGLKPLIHEQKSAFLQTQKKISELKRLIASGKYNASFGVYKKIQHLFEHLANHQKQRLQRDYDNVSEKMAELSDWEHYIATPRKQRLLKDVQAIIDEPLDNPTEQAAKVKLFRKTWNSLGHADDELDKGLNEEFNQLCEQAFAPCRLYYAEQEKLREQHLAVRLGIIEEARALTAKIDLDPVDWKKLDGELNKLNHKWQKAGEVDRSKYKELHHSYQEALKPLKTAIKDFHQTNIEKKKALIAQAEKELNNQDIFSAIQGVKELQSQWRNVGYAGPKEENKLWQSFRKINDDLFKRRDEIKEEEQSQQQEHKAAFEQSFSDIKNSIGNKENLSELNQAIKEAGALLTKVIAHKPVIKSVATQVENFIADTEQQISKLHQEKAKQNWLNVFSLLELVSTENPEHESLTENNLYQTLPAFWQKKFQELLAKDNIVDRSQKTLELEILAGVESPSEFTQERLSVQVALMQDRMSSGAEVDLQAEFVAWLNCGKLTEQDNALIARLKPVFCK